LSACLFIGESADRLAALQFSRQSERLSYFSKSEIRPAKSAPAAEAILWFHLIRPLQEEIIRDSLAGRDVFALLPTGGGKSLCFQLPALARDGLTVVVSPLIALMKDQVDALQAGGVPATFLNSSLAAGVVGSVLR